MDRAKSTGASGAFVGLGRGAHWSHTPATRLGDPRTYWELLASSPALKSLEVVIPVLTRTKKLTTLKFNHSFEILLRIEVTGQTAAWKWEKQKDKTQRITARGSRNHRCGQQRAHCLPARDWTGTTLRIKNSWGPTQESSRTLVSFYHQEPHQACRVTTTEKFP